MTRVQAAALFLSLSLAACGADAVPVASVSPVETTTTTIEATTTTVEVTTTTTEPTTTTTTTTTEPPPPPAVTQPQPRPVATAPAVPRTSPAARKAAGSGSGACGGDLPPCYVMEAESGGDPNAVNPGGCGGRGCYGKWQFDPRTSASLGYDRPMNEYSEAEQDEAARKLMARSGCGQWSTC